MEKLKSPTIYIILLLLLSNTGFIFNIIDNSEPPENLEATKLEYPYIDSGCKFSKYELDSYINKLNENFDIELSYFYYEHPSRAFCQNRPVISNLYDKNLEIGAKEILPIGIGVNTDLNNLQFTARSILLFLTILFIFNNFKLYSINFKKISFKKVLYLTIILSIYGTLVYPTISNAISDILFQVFIGNIIIFLIVVSHPFDAVFKTIISLIIFPLFFFDSNLSFWWLFILPALEYSKEFKFFRNKTLLFLLSALSLSLINIKEFTFIKKLQVNDWILFSNGRHKGGIVDIADGYQTLTYLFDLLILLFVFFIFFSKYSKNYSNIENVMTNGLISGFIIWFISYFISQLHPILNYFIFTLFGLNENIDTIESVQPDGVNWRGVTSSHELTGFWLLIIFCILIYQIVYKKNYYYIPVLPAIIISINWNSQRTTLLLISLFLIFLLFNLKNFKTIFLLVLLSLASVTIFFQDSVSLERLTSRIQSLDNNYKIDEQLRWEIAQSLKRFDKYDLDIKKPNYEFTEVTNYTEFYQRELNTDNMHVINVLNYLTKIFGREFQWFRFFYLTDFDKQDLLIGSGPGQSHQHLVQLIEKPHSLYFSVFYQYGVFGVLFLIWLGKSIFYKFITNNFYYIYLLGLYFFIVGIKAEMIFTHNQLVFFICFMYYCLFFEKKDIAR